MQDLETQLQRQQIMNTSKSVDAFHELALENLEILDDSDLDQMFARTTDLELFAWLTRGRIYEIKLQRNIEAGSPKTEKQIAEELAELKNLHFKTLMRDAKVAGLFIKYQIDLPKHLYQLVLPLEPEQQALMLKAAKRQRNAGTFNQKLFKAKVLDMKKGCVGKQPKSEIIHKLTLELTDRELADLNKIIRGFKNVSGYGKGALGYALRSFQAEMARLKPTDFPDNDWVVKTVIRVVAADMAYRQARAGYESKNKKKVGVEELN